MINVFAFQSNLGQELRTLLSFEQNSQSKKLKDNIFNDLEYCIPLLKRAFQCPPGLKSFSPTDIENVKNLEAKKWLLFGNEGKNIWAGVGLQLHDDLIEIECTALFCVRRSLWKLSNFVSSILFSHILELLGLYSIIWDRLSLDEVKMFWREYLETSIGILYNAPGTRES